MNLFSKGLALLTILATFATPAAAARPDVFFDGDRVSAVAFETPLRDLLRALAAETGLQVRFTSDAGLEPVDVEIFELPLSEALARILAHRGHTRIGSRLWISAPVAGFAAEEPVVTGGAHAGYVAELGRQAIGNESNRGRLAATAELVRERTEAAIEALQNVFSGEADSQVRAAALRGLDRHGALSIESLADLARDAGAGMLRRKAIQLLARDGGGSPVAAAVLTELADTATNPIIRLTARTALRNLDQSAA